MTTANELRQMCARIDEILRYDARVQIGSCPSGYEVTVFYGHRGNHLHEQSESLTEAVRLAFLRYRDFTPNESEVKE